MKLSSMIVMGLTLVVAFLVIYPIFMLLFGSFMGGPPGAGAGFSLKGYEKAYFSPETYRILLTTIWLSAVRAVLAMSLAIYLAWVVTRTDTPWRKGLEVLIWLKFFLPSLPLTVAWILLAGPKGFINEGLSRLFHLEEPVFNIFSYGGIIWVSTISWVAMLFILITPAFRGMDAALEESSRMSGASSFATLRRITIPVLKPALLGAFLLGFIRLLESFETELFLGYGQGIYVYTTRIWWLMGITPADHPQAMALSTIFLLLVGFIIFIQWRLLGQRQYTTVTGRGFTTRPTRLGRWRYVTLASVLLYFILAVVLPLGVLALGSFMRVWGIFVAEPYTIKHWVRTFSDPRFALSLRNTMLVGVGAATIGIIIYGLISYIIIKTKFLVRKPLDFITWLPWGVPSLVLALGFLWAFQGGLPFLSFLFGTIWLLILIFIVKGFPLGVRVMNGAMYQLGNELEESSRVLGASWTYTFRKIMLPLISPAAISTWIILFMLTARDLVTVVFLYSPQSRLLSIILFEHWLAGEYERATVVGLILTVILMASALVARWLGTKQEVTP
ncbi:MAG: Iron ABC transporter permease [Dehalococcoidia bacterium]|nr:Iron ABC transporter permease [Dehalococcoidia bacterium]